MQEGNKMVVILSAELILSEIDKIKLSKIYMLFMVDVFLMYFTENVNSLSCSTVQNFSLLWPCVCTVIKIGCLKPLDFKM